MDARHSAMLTRCHQVARTPPAFFSLELRRPLRSISTASALRPRSARPIAIELPTTPAPITITSNRFSLPAVTQRFYQAVTNSPAPESGETRRSESLGPFSGGVEHAQDLDGLVAHPICNDIWGSGYHQFAGAGDASEPARGWMGAEQLDA